MPISLSKIANNTAKVTVQVGSDAADTVTTVYYPGRITEKFFTLFDNAGETDTITGFEEFNKTLSSVIQSWDVFEDDAQTQMFPIDPARFSELPISLRMQIYGVIIGDMRPEAMVPQIQS